MPFFKKIHDFIITTLGARGFLHHGKAPASELPSCDCGGKKRFFALAKIVTSLLTYSSFAMKKETSTTNCTF